MSETAFHVEAAAATFGATATGGRGAAHAPVIPERVHAIL